MTRILAAIVATIVITAAVIQNFGCGETGSARSLAADEVYVAPGEHDKYYAFLSGGQSGSVFVVGIPSGRLIREIPVFEPRAAYGYAVHHNDPRRQRARARPAASGATRTIRSLSETNGVYDGKYLWINDLANGRLARIRLDYFETDRIVKIPNMQGAHGIAVVSPNTKYIVVNGEFEQPTDGLATNPAPYTSVCRVRRSRQHGGEVRGARQRQHRHRRHARRTAATPSRPSTTSSRARTWVA